MNYNQNAVSKLSTTLSLDNVRKQSVGTATWVVDFVYYLYVGRADSVIVAISLNFTVKSDKLSTDLPSAIIFVKSPNTI